MGALVALIWSAFLRIIPTVAGQVLIGLGISVVTYTGVDTSLSFLKSQALSSIGGMPAEVVGLLSYLKVGVCISIVTSAMVARATLSGLTGTIKRFVKK